MIDKVKYGGSSSAKSLGILGKATGLNAEDVRFRVRGSVGLSRRASGTHGLVSGLLHARRGSALPKGLSLRECPPRSARAEGAPQVNTALTSPRKIAYLEETMRAIEQGNLKIRVRSLENEMALTRLSTQSKATTNLLLASVVLNAAGLVTRTVPQYALFAAAAGLGAQGLGALLSLSAFDKKAAKYTSKEFN